MPLDLEWVRSRLPEREITWFDSIDSTMPEATRRAAAGCPHGTVVGADHQTAGQGRYGRHWLSQAWAGLYVSVVLRFPFPALAFPGLTLAIGLAVREAIVEATGLVCDLRWPNDLLLGGKKCAGILLNLESTAVVSGIGINVNHESFPEELAMQATSLRLGGGREYPREPLLVELLRAIDRYSELITEQGIAPVLLLFSAASSFVNDRRVQAEHDGKQVEGMTVGLDEQGFLRIRKDNGSVITILAGGVRPAGER